MLVVFVAKILECLNVLNLIENFPEVFYDVGAKGLDIFELDKFKQLQNGRLKKVVPAVVTNEGLNDRSEKVTLDDVSEVGEKFNANKYNVVVLILTGCRNRPSWK